MRHTDTEIVTNTINDLWADKRTFVIIVAEIVNAQLEQNMYLITSDRNKIGRDDRKIILNARCKNAKVIPFENIVGVCILAPIKYTKDFKAY